VATADVAPDLDAVRVTVYVRAVPIVFEGNGPRLVEADPDVHDTVDDPTLGFEENLHVVALETLAARLTFRFPPDAGRYAGVAVNEEMDGGGVGSTVTVTGVAWTFPPPLTLSLNV
jgi:hypothetical protein